MDCGIGFNDLLSYVGLCQPEKEASTPSTVGTDRDESENAARDAALFAARKQLSYGICVPAVTAPAITNDGGIVKEEMKFTGCDPTTCRMNAGICIDCTYCKVHCKCDSNSKGSLNNKAIGNSRYTTTETTKPLQIQLRKTPSLMSDGSSDGSSVMRRKRSSTKAKASSPSKSFILKNDKQNKNARRYDMEDDGPNLYLTHRMLKEHTNRSNRSYRSSGGSSHSNSHTSGYVSYNSRSSSQRRYNFGDEDEDNIFQQQQTTRRTRTRRGHRRTASSGTQGSRKSNASLSLLVGKIKLGNKKMDPDDPIIGKTFSFDSTNSHSSGMGSAHSADPTRSSATTARRRNSHRAAGGSLSSSSRSFLDGSDVEAEAEAVSPKKSWFRRRLESKE